jgi:hypothetical protein
MIEQHEVRITITVPEGTSDYDAALVVARSLQTDLWLPSDVTLEKVELGTACCKTILLKGLLDSLHILERLNK